MPPRVKDETGNIYGRLTVLSYSGSKLKALAGAYWNCRCECGKDHVVAGRALRNGSIQSCGCTKAAANRMSSSSEYRVWHDMKRRCYDTKRRDYKYYGWRSIVVCERWRSSFVDFFDDMGPKPFPGATIERIDNDGNYEKSNCKWATQEEQKKNTRNVRKITYNGETMGIGDWARKLGINRCTLRLRLDKGLPLEEVFSKDNYCWASKKARMLTYNGETYCLREWARRLGITHRTLSVRLAKGWSPEKVFSSEHYFTPPPIKKARSKS